MKSSALELGESLEEDGDERLDVDGCLLGRGDGLTVLRVREPNAGGLIEEEGVLWRPRSKKVSRRRTRSKRRENGTNEFGVPTVRVGLGPVDTERGIGDRAGSWSRGEGEVQFQPSRGSRRERGDAPSS